MAVVAHEVGQEDVHDIRVEAQAGGGHGRSLASDTIAMIAIASASHLDGPSGVS
jgi:hypothetical protein